MKTDKKYIIFNLKFEKPPHKKFQRTHSSLHFPAPLLKFNEKVVWKTPKVPKSEADTRSCRFMLFIRLLVVVFETNEKKLNSLSFSLPSEEERGRPRISKIHMKILKTTLKMAAIKL